MSNPLGNIQPRSLKRLSKYLMKLVSSKLWLKIIIALGFGVIIGIVFGPSTNLIDKNLSRLIGNWLAVPGKIFLAAIQMIVVPLVFASIITGLTASENMNQLKKMGSRLVPYFVLTTVVSITIGLTVALVIQPGNYIDNSSANIAMESQEVNQQIEGNEEIGDVTAATLPNMITNVLPENPLGAMVEKQMLQVVLFSIIFGLALVVMPRKQAQPLLDLLASVQEVCMTVVRWAMLLAPIAVFGLIAQITMKVGIEALLGMAVYVGTVLLGLAILLVFYLVLITIIAKRSPIEFLKTIREVQLLAFSTSSSAAVMPLSIETAEEKLGVKPAITQFLIPLGATINMDGTALYQGAATVFLAQVFGVDLSIGALLLVIVTAVGASIGSPSTPGVGIVILSMVLSSVGIPAGGVALIIGVDRILDMSRTAINVTGDLTATLVMEKWLEEPKDQVA